MVGKVSSARTYVYMYIAYTVQLDLKLSENHV